MPSKSHWEQVYTTKSTQAVSWYQARATLSLDLVQRIAGGAQVAPPTGQYDIWHDRAVFHFLTEPAARAAYVVRYAPGALHAEFGGSFELLEHLREDHQTPAGAVQHFVYCHCVMH